MSPKTSVFLFALFLPVALYFAVFAALASIALISPPGVFLQAPPAILSVVIVLYWVPFWIFRTLVARPNGLLMQSRSRIFLVCLGVFVVAVAVLLLTTANGLATPIEGTILYYVVAFAGYAKTARWLQIENDVEPGPEVF